MLWDYQAPYKHQKKICTKMICKRRTSVYEQVANKKCASENSIRIYSINIKLWINISFGMCFRLFLAAYLQCHNWDIYRKNVMSGWFQCNFMYFKNKDSCNCHNPGIRKKQGKPSSTWYKCFAPSREVK